MSPAGSRPPLYLQPFAALANKTREQHVQELADREEIRELIGRYAHRVAHGVSVADLFTDDGAFITHMPGQGAQEVRGRAALDKHYGVARAPGTAMPMIHNFLLAVAGDDATGLCSIELRVGADGQSIIASGYYEDRFRREDGCWKFVVREATFFHWVPLQQGWAGPPKPMP